jgi:adenine-specific DNA-methyltransferase
MTNKKQRLELTWIGKDARPKLEPQILLAVPARSYHAKHRVTKNDLFDNLLTLKAREQASTGNVKRAPKSSAKTSIEQ